MEHSKFLLSFLEDVIMHVDRSAMFTDAVRRFGRAHAHLYRAQHMPADVWEWFGATKEQRKITSAHNTGETLTESLYHLDAIKRTKDAMAAWRILIANITDQLRSVEDKHSSSMNC